MAATSEERGIRHIKDVFSSPPAPKGNSMTFLARKPLAPAPPSRTSAEAAKQNGVSKTNTTPKPPVTTSKNGGGSKTATVDRTDSKAGNMNDKGKGGAFLRAEKDKNINAMELPVPVTSSRNQANKTTPPPPLNKTPQKSKTPSVDNTQPKAKSGRGREEVYLSPSLVSSPTSPGYSKQFPSPNSPGYSSKIAATSPTSPTNKSPGYAKTSSEAVKHPAPSPPRTLPFTRAVVELQPMQSPSYDTNINGFGGSRNSSNGLNSPPMSPGYTTDTPQLNGNVYAHHVDVHRPADFVSASSGSPVYDRKLDFLNHPAPVSPDQDVGSLFSGDDNQDMPYTPPTLHSPAAITTLDKTNNNSSSLFKKKDSKSDKGGRFGNKKRHSGDETISSLAPSSGYHSEFDSEISSPSSPKSPISRGTKITEDDSAFDEEECTFDFADDDAMYNGNRQYPVFQEYGGEDYSKYMQDDSDSLPQYSTTSLARKVQQKRRQQQQLQNSRPPQQRQYASNPRPGGLKSRISQALTMSKQEKNKYVYQAQPLTKIHQFSFMDSKMGTYSDEKEIQEYMTRDMETRSDLGGAKRDYSLPPWHNDTLSVSTLRRAKKLLDQQHQLSSSVPNLANSKDKSFQNSTPELRHKGESYSDFGADIKQKKKVNRFKFWKLFGKKKSKKDSIADSASSLGFDEPTTMQLQADDRVMDVRL